MSELQVALLAIGLGVVVAVYVFGWWKQRQYSRKFGAAFSQQHDDALYQEKIVQPEQLVESASLIPEESMWVNQDALAGVDSAVEAEIVAELPVIDMTTTLSEPCALLDIRSDFIIELHLAEPASAAVLDGLWQRKFDFRKPVQVCGLTLAALQWERVIAESQPLYSKFRIALQLVDRSGVIAVAKLGDFRDLVQGIALAIQADATVPDIQEVHRTALALDAFCAEADQMVGVNLRPQGDRLITGGKVAQAAVLHGMRLESDGAFHLFDTQGHSLMTLINQDSKPFQHHTLEQSVTAGITLLLDVPRVAEPAENFDLLVKIAHQLAGELQLSLVDDNKLPLTDAGLARIRAQLLEVEAKMRENDLIPGSAQARRLFS
ncbi:MAG: cell division protein ZipA C-terminal FtsZ-binding domain-containing protein [Gallionella sp.]|nr:cell division protein ZipA C-terminal FtsZ-binding domain-containing protein [Gallionella sp.]